MMVIGVATPTGRAIDDDADPDATGVPFTVIVAFGSTDDGVIVIDGILFGTSDEYPVTVWSKAGVRAPSESLSDARFILYPLTSPPSVDFLLLPHPESNPLASRIAGIIT